VTAANEQARRKTPLTDPLVPSPKRPASADGARRQAADAALRRVQRETETLGTRLQPAETEDDGMIELWGKRIGRGLGAIAVLYFLWQLAMILVAGK